MHLAPCGRERRSCYTAGRKKETLHSTVIRPVKGYLYSIMFVINIIKIMKDINIIEIMLKAALRLRFVQG